MGRRWKRRSVIIAPGGRTCWCMCSTCRERRPDRRTEGPRDRNCEGHTEPASVCPSGPPVLLTVDPTLLAVALRRSVEECLILRDRAQDLLRRFRAHRALLRHVRAHDRQHVLAELRVGARLRL